MICGAMERALQVRFFDEKIVEEELATDVDGYDVRAIVEVGQRHGIVGKFFVNRRPFVGEYDAVVERLASEGIGG